MSDLKDILRLELDRDDITNGITNHSGVANVSGWSFADGVTGTARTSTSPLLGAYKGRHAVLASGSPAAFRVYAPAVPISSGRGISATIAVAAALPGQAVPTYAQMRVVQVNAANAVLSDVAAGPKVPISRPGAVPAMVVLDTRDYDAAPMQAYSSAAVSVRIAVDFYRDNNQPENRPVFLSRAALFVSTDEALLRGVAFTDPALAPLDMLGNSNQITVNRGLALSGVTVRTELGTLDATIVDPAVDPAANDRVRANRPVRLSALSGGTWHPLAAGNIGPLRTVYDREGRTVVSLTALDAQGAAAKAATQVSWTGDRSSAYGRTLRRAGFRWGIVDNTPYQGFKIASAGPSNMADDLDVLRTSFADHLWVDKKNIWRIRDTLPTTPQLLFSDTKSDAEAVYYSDIDVDFGTGSLVNSLTITRVNADQGQGEAMTAVIGPLVNEQSVAEWGEQAAPMHINGGDPFALAQSTLAKFGTPARAVKSLVFPVFSRGKLNTRHLAAACSLEICNAVRVKRGTLLDSTVRVLTIKHEITATTWRVHLTFMPIETASPVVVTTA